MARHFSCSLCHRHTSRVRNGSAFAQNHDCDGSRYRSDCGKGRASGGANASGEPGIRENTGIPGQSGANVRTRDISLTAENLTNSTELASTMMTKVWCRAGVMATGNLELRAQGYLLAEVPTFNADFQTSNIDLSEFHGIIERAA